MREVDVIADWVGRFLQRLRGGAPSTSGVSDRRASRLRYYRADLLGQLKDEHAELQRLFQAITDAHREGAQERAISNLLSFAALLRTHLLKENLHLYMYLTEAYADDPQQSRALATIRQEMRQIGRALNLFTATYARTPWDDSMAARFPAELASIHTILDRRIVEEEERLYPLYQAPAALGQRKALPASAAT